MQNLDQSADCFSPHRSVVICVYYEYSFAGIIFPCAHIRKLQADPQSIHFSPHLGSIWPLCVSLYYRSPVVKADGSSVNFTQVPFKPQWRWPTLIWTFNQADDHRAFSLRSKCSFLDQHERNCKIQIQILIHFLFFHSPEWFLVTEISPTFILNFSILQN